MDRRAEVKAFLTSRRARIAAPADTSGRRRVPGLRRGEVADRAGVSVEYYAKIERGNLTGVSDGVLDAIGRALQLDDTERAHLADLASAGPRREPVGRTVRPALARVLEGITAWPALLNDERLDVLAANPLGRALYSPAFADPDRPVNLARFDFLDPRARAFWPDWERAADEAVALLRAAVGRAPDDEGLARLVDELAVLPAFRARWAAHDVLRHDAGTKDFCHPDVGSLRLAFEVMTVRSEPGLSLVVLSADPGSADQDALARLATVTHDRA